MSTLLLFWFLWLLKVDCVLNDKTGDVTCYLHTWDGREVICKKGQESTPPSERHLALKPDQDAECMIPFIQW